jgi:ABC-type antimicrobial peptide transport system permease subunit
MVREPSLGPGEAPGPWYEIVGVVQDVTVMRRKGPDDAVLYRPAAAGASPLRLLVRTYGPALSMAQRVEVVADTHVIDVMSLDRVAHAEAFPTYFFLRISVVVAAVALLLSTAGIYALISFTLARRTREIGIRVALGAAPRRIITGVFSRAFTQIGIGVLVGAVPGIVVLTSDDSGRMGFAISSVVTLAIALFVMLVAAVSCAGPLRRALRIEPTQALRAD